MAPTRIRIMAIALSIAFGSIGAGSTHRSATDQNVAGAIVSSLRMADGKEWTTANLNVNVIAILLLRRCRSELPSIRPVVYVGVGAASVPVARRRLALANRRRMAADGEALRWRQLRFG